MTIHKGSYGIALCIGAIAMLMMTSCKEEKNSTHTLAEQAIEVPKEQRVRLLFAGDAMCHSPQFRSALQADGTFDFKESFAGVKSYFDRADIAIVNLETTISPDSRYTGYPCFSSPPAYADALAWLGTDVAMLANNHCCDRGAKGIRTTIAKLDSLGIAHTGAFHCEEEFARNEIIRIDYHDVKFAIINYTYGTNGIPTPKGCLVNRIDTTLIAKTLEKISEDTDCVIACMHWGNEYQRQPARTQRKLAEFLHSKGVDLVVGSHPHVVQPYVATDSLITIYSLGNFISNQSKPHTDGGIIAEIELVKSPDGVCRYTLNTIPVWVMKPGHKLISPETALTTEMLPYQRTKYNRFIHNTEQLLAGGVK